MYSHSDNSHIAPGSADGIDSGSAHSSPRSPASSESGIDIGNPIIIGLFGSDSGDGLKNRFFETLCGDDHPMKETSSTLIQRGKLSTESGTGRSVYLWKFPSLHEGTWLQKAEAFLRVTAHIGNYIRHFHGIIYVHGIDDDEDGEAFELFRTLIGEDGLTRSLLLSGDPIEPDTENMGLPKAALPLVSRGACSEIIERFLEPSHIPVPSLFQLEIANGKPMGNTAAGILFDKRLKDARGTLECAFGLIYGKIVSPPVSPPSKSSTPRRRSRTVALANELSETRRQLSELEHAYTTLGCNSSEQVSDLEESNKELRSENESLQAEIESLKDALNDLRQKTAQNQAETQECCIQTETQSEVKPTREELQNEVRELKDQLVGAKLDEAMALKKSATLSQELTEARTPLADAQRANTELEKTVGSLKKRVETLTKAAEMKKEEADRAKAETTKADLHLKSTKDTLEKAQRQLKEWATTKAKLEDERAKAISVSEGLLKIKDHVEKQLTEAKSQIDSVKKQASAGISQLKESLAEKESQVREIARAAEVWTLASAEVKRLKEELKLLQVCREAGEREAHSERQRLQVELRQANEEWGAERMRLEADVSSLGRNNEALRDQLEVLSKERDNEASGYMARIAELEHWCEQRWDAVGNNCVIA